MRRTKDFGKRWGSGHRARWRGASKERGDEGYRYALCVLWPRRNERNLRRFEVLGTARLHSDSKPRHFCVDLRYSGKIYIFDPSIQERAKNFLRPLFLFFFLPFFLYIPLTSFGIAFFSTLGVEVLEEGRLLVINKRADIRLEGGETAVIFNQRR